MATAVSTDLTESPSRGDSASLRVPRPEHSGAADLSEPRDSHAANTGIGVLPLLWRRIVLFVAGLAAILVAIELILTATGNRQLAATAELYRVPTPFIEFYQRPNASGNIATNEIGFRYESLPLAKPPGETRIFFLSTSVGFNGSSNDTTIAGYMERQLASLTEGTGERIRVVNASGVSFSPTQSLVLLTTRVLDYSPDVIVIFHGPEVLYYATHYEGRPGYPFNFTVREHMHDILTGRVVDREPIVAQLQQTAIMNYFHPDLVRNARQTQLSMCNTLARIDTVDQYDPYIDTLTRDIEKITRISAAYGCRTLVAVPPARPSVLLPEALDRLTDRVRTTVETKLASTATYVDTATMVDNITAQHLWQPDGMHWHDKGNALIADRLTRALTRIGVSTHWGQSAFRH